MAIQASLIDALEQAGDSAEAKRILLPHKGKAGLSKLYFDRVAEHFVADPSKAFALARQWKAVAQLGDEPAYAYRAKGVADRGRCDWLASAKAFQKAGELATRPADKLAFQAGAVDALARAKKMQDAERLGASLAAGLKKLGREDLAARVLLNLGNALLLQDRMAEARKYLERALQAFDAAGLQSEAVSTLLGLSTSHLYSGDPRKAEQLANETKVRAEIAGLPFAADMAEMNRAQALLLSGRPDDALDLFLSLKDRLAVSPTEQTRSIEFAGDAYYRLNLWPEALDAYREALSRTGSIQPNHEANVRLGIGLSLLATGKPAEALPYFAAAHRRYLKLNNLAWASACLLGKAQAQRAQKQHKGASTTAKQAADLAHRANSAYHWCEAVLSHRAPPQEMRRALKIIQGYGYVGLAWRAHHALAQSFQTRQTQHYKRMVDSMLEARLLTSSLTSRSSFLKDKSDALREYLAVLLERPTKRNVAEALRVIVETRSVTLLDELLSAQGEALHSGVQEQLQAVRSELQALAAEESTPNGARRGYALDAVPPETQRRWTNAARKSRALMQTLPRAIPDGVAVLAQAGDHSYSISSGQSRRLTRGAEDLRKALKWLEYELMAPMVDPDAPAKPALDALANLRELLGPLGDVNGLCPDGLLWRVPWQCLGPQAPDLLLHPSANAAAQLELPKNPRVLLWVSHAVDLPHGAAEARQFLGRYPQAKVCTTAGEALASLEHAWDIVHVVSHAKHRVENPMFSSIEMADGPVFAADIARSGLRAGLVTLAACDTGAVSLVSREEPDGLARAFLARGASHVVASAWALHDEAAAKAFGTFYADLDVETDVREALQSARRHVREWRAHPYYWGALAMYRGYRS
ncbi:MAG: hypothetical protein QOJ65_550 [Fimbriimonadaceae bacterium]|jgi:tetratricopeptide (TPR) repeat protein|nr:hypothetical protein [Fimbriimonadaceae bacterium]